MTFRDLHNQRDPLLLGNVWDVASAQVTEAAGFRALGTSSAAVAAQRGYPDGERVAFSEVVALARRITSNSDLPLTVDLEGGYSREPSQIADHIQHLANLGVVGVNWEDSVVDGTRTLLPPDTFARTLEAVKNELTRRRVDVFLNLRTDAFLLGHSDALAETQRRIVHYQRAGADGIFVPGMVQEEAIEAVVQSTTLPINVMSLPGLPGFTTLRQLGVRRISTGNFLFDTMHRQLAHTLRAVVDSQSFQPIFEYAD